jgi:hypothetical protein
VYRNWLKRGKRHNDHDKIREVQNSTNNVHQTYCEQLGNKLSEPQTGKIISALHLKVSQKHSNIPPIINNNIYVTNFQQKANIFNDYFADQCKIHDNGSTLPENISKTNASISYIKVTSSYIAGLKLKRRISICCQKLFFRLIYINLKGASFEHNEKLI